MNRFVRCAVSAALLLLVTSPDARLAAQAAHPKLVVLIAVDQMRGDYPERYAPLFDKGLKRLTTQGAWYKNAAYPYLNTLTCVGHTTLGTGSLPYRHGMIQNVWYNRETGKTMACTADPKVHDVSVGGATASGLGDSAVNMLVPTLAELMKRDFEARVVTMSIKARSAIGLAGHSGDAVLWFDGQGRIQTSSAYAGMPPAWAVDFNDKNPVSKDAGKTWERTLPADRYQYTDEPPGEKPGGGWTAAFPHPLGEAGDARFFAHWEQSPYSDEYLERLAERAVEDLKLGKQAHPDFLGISFSAVDIVGHAFGPRSHEVQDVLVRLDATLGRLLTFLDEKVGPGNYVLALSADHGVADVPEQVANAGRVIPATVVATIEAALKAAYPDGPFVAQISGNDVYLKTGVYDKLKGDRATLAAVKRAVEAMPGVAQLVTADEVSSAAARVSKDPHIRAAALSFFPDRSGDLIVIPKENWIYGNTTTTHGTWYPYDQHVPLLLYGAGIRPGVHLEPAIPPDIAATLASLVGVTLPAPDGHVLKAALRARGTKR